MSQKPQRIYSIDAVRATALLLILMAHSFVAFGSHTMSWACTTQADTVSRFLFDYLFLGNGFMMFSFLFGLSFFFQMDHADAKGIDFRGRFCWRLALLLVFGIIHNAFYASDILMIFALAGFMLVLVHKVGTRWLVALLAVMLAQPLVLDGAIAHYNGTWVPGTPLVQTPPADPATLWEAIKLNSTDLLLWKAQYQWESGRLLYTLGMFLLGTITGRLRLFEQPRAKYLPRVAAGGLVFLLAMVAVENTVPQDFKYYMEGWRQVATVATLIPFLAWFYGLPCLQKFLQPLYSIGRSTLTAYIMQGVVLTLVFYAYGLGWGGTTTMGERLLIALGFYVLQMLFFTLWLKYNKFGPLEGVWRRLTRIGMK